MDRRLFFKYILETIKGKLPSNKEQVRPPGADPQEEKFLQLCTGCDACMAACPINVIIVDDLEKRDPFLPIGTCIHCPDYPCIASCPTSALNHNNGTKLRLRNESCNH